METGGGGYLITGEVVGFESSSSSLSAKAIFFTVFFTIIGLPKNASLLKPSEGACGTGACC